MLQQHIIRACGCASSRVTFPPPSPDGYCCRIVQPSHTCGDGSWSVYTASCIAVGNTFS